MLSTAKYQQSCQSWRVDGTEQIPGGRKLTVKCILHVGWGNITKLGIGASCVTQPCAYTHAFAMLHNLTVHHSLHVEAGKGTQKCLCKQ